CGGSRGKLALPVADQQERQRTHYRDRCADPEPRRKAAEGIAAERQCGCAETCAELKDREDHPVDLAEGLEAESGADHVGEHVELGAERESDQYCAQEHHVARSTQGVDSAADASA